jgi:hypothetical protein
LAGLFFQTNKLTVGEAGNPVTALLAGSAIVAAKVPYISAACR